eukprot:8714168-Alexandrium_andersonii.AAC.1
MCNHAYAQACASLRTRSLRCCIRKLPHMRAHRSGMSVRDRMFVRLAGAGGDAGACGSTDVSARAFTHM